ncbi:MAG: ABC transporter transmembrane domain-containing protein [Ancrocorticia sp.]|uniref:ABC transporter transmembrane domain-containing protein n=1 Tax=Ancrocorticia sp. TaxID=2593684 RepID=UPI003F90B8B3
MINGVKSATQLLMTEDGRSRLRWGLVLAVIGGILEGLSLLTLLPLTDALVNGSSGLSFTSWLVVLVVLALLGGVIKYNESMYGYTAAADVVRSGHLRLGDRLARLPIGWFTPQRAGELSRLVTSGFMDVGSALAHMLLKLTRNLLAVLSVGIGIWFFSVRLGVVFLLAMPVAVLLLWVGTKLSDKAHRIAFPTNEEFSSRVVEYARTQPTLRAAGQSANFRPLMKALDANDRALVKQLWLQTAGLVQGESPHNPLW